MVYAERLQDAMRVAKLDTATLARGLGVSYQAVRKVLLGGQFGTENNAAAAKLLGVSSDWLATGKGEARPSGVAPASDTEPLLDKYGQTLLDLEAIPPGKRNRLLDMITDAADEAREAAAHLGAFASPTAEALRPEEIATPEDEEIVKNLSRPPQRGKRNESA